MRTMGNYIQVLKVSSLGRGDWSDWVDAHVDQSLLDAQAIVGFVKLYFDIWLVMSNSCDIRHGHVETCRVLDKPAFSSMCANHVCVEQDTMKYTWFGITNMSSRTQNLFTQPRVNYTQISPPQTSQQFLNSLARFCLSVLWFNVPVTKHGHVATVS